MLDEFTYIAPMKASLSSVEFLTQVNNDHVWAAGEKMDGYREVLYLGAERNEMLSSLGNSHIAKCPQFQEVRLELAGTVLDCEGMSPTRILEDNAACFKSDPVNAIEWQKKHGAATLVAFDCLRYKGIDCWKEQFGSRRVALEETVLRLKVCGWNIKIERLVFEDKLAYYNSIVARTQSEGHEGVILKRLSAPYEPGRRSGSWLKVKREETVVTTITGFYNGAGKFANMVGSIVFKEGSASGMDDTTRQDMTDHPDKYIGHKVKIHCQEITRLGSLRHPRYGGMVD